MCLHWRVCILKYLNVLWAHGSYRVNVDVDRCDWALKRWFRIADGGGASCLGDTRRRGRASVRHRTSGQCLVLRQRRPELYTSCDFIRLLSGSLREPLLPRFLVQQRHNERPDKLPLGGAEQRRDIQRRDEWPGQKSTHEIRRVSRTRRLPFAADLLHSAAPSPCRSTMPAAPGNELMPVRASSGKWFSVTFDLNHSTCPTPWES